MYLTSYTPPASTVLRREFVHAVQKVADKWNARVLVSIYNKKVNYSRLREIPILDVCSVLQVPLVRTGSSTWNVKQMADSENDSQSYTSLCIFTGTNTWHRFSGKERGSVRKGSVIDFVSHIKDCSFQEAVAYLSASFPQYTSW